MTTRKRRLSLDEHPKQHRTPSIPLLSIPDHLQMNKMSMITPTSTSPPSPTPSTWLIIGASRGIGLEFTRQLLARGEQVIAAVRDPSTAAEIWKLAAGGMSPISAPGQHVRPGNCIIEQCDVTDEDSINALVDRMRVFVERGAKIENIILNAGILRYDKGIAAMNVGMTEFMLHLQTNCVGVVVAARKLLDLNKIIPGSVGKKVVFISSDSGSMIDFRDFEDGFAAYAASKAALNMMIRHMAAELKRKADNAVKDKRDDKEESWAGEVCVLAVHPGEVQTDMANFEVDWEVEGIISAKESVRDMLKVIPEKNSTHTGTFWCWDGREHPW